MSGKRVKYSHNYEESEEEEDYYSTDDGLSYKPNTGSSSGNNSNKLKSKLKSIKKYTTNKFNAMEDVDDDLDNQIPLI